MQQLAGKIPAGFEGQHVRLGYTKSELYKSTLEETDRIHSVGYVARLISQWSSLRCRL